VRAPTRLYATASLAVIALLTPHRSAQAAPPSTHEVIAQVIQAYGGRAALDSVRAYRCEGSVFAVQQHQESPTVRVFQRPDRFKILIEYPTRPEVRIVDGAKGWRTAGGDTVGPASGMMLEAMMLQAARADLPWILAERESLVRFVEPDSATLAKLDGKKATGLEIPLAEGLTLRAWLDGATHRVTLSQGILQHGAMSTRFEVVYSDYRAVNGIWFAFKEQSSASGMQTGVTTIKSVVMNPPIRPDDFVPPPPAPKKAATSG
jgi:hypothetical protein